ncbi:hypothetical protein Nepgr_019747 [Nepenthes gracilis]|uniref:J domain-containing protein n=1 Tax=Nepenthes gracilis TaxID=150966 RepID=A0AAD3SVV1_NEPGR|nr:hypothetical protein Nepgr_019747 [Nepenthes gracilis]
MDPNTQKAEAERWLGIAAKLLTARDFLGSKTFAIRARESDPNNVISDQILSIVDTLLAAEKKINNQYDWYAILQLAHLARDPELIASQYRRLVLLLSPDRNRLPFADFALRLVVDAWSVLSDPNKKWLYDSELSLCLQRIDSHRVDPVRVDPVRVDPAQLNTFQFFQQQPQPPPPQRPPQQQQLPQWQQRQQQLDELQQQQQQQHMQFQERLQQQLQEVWWQQQRQQQPEQQLLERQQQPEQQLLERQQLQQQQQQQQQHREQPREFLQPQQQEQENQPQPARQVERQTSQDNEAERNEGTTTDSHGNANSIVDVPSFWTACPYCFYMYEYPDIYQDCTLRCQNCRRGFHAAQIQSPPPIASGSVVESSFCCWGFVPLGFSMRKWKNMNHPGNKNGFSSWVPFSPMFACPVNGKGNVGGYVFPVGGKKNVGRKSWGSTPASRAYADVDEIFLDFSESSDDSDSSGDWRNRRKKKGKRVRRRRRYGRKANVARENKGNQHFLAEGEVTGGENLQGTAEIQEGAASMATGAKADVIKKAGGSNSRKQTGRAAKDRGKLDLNVEFSNEVEEHAPTMSAGNGQEEAIEGIAFFEGLDEFLSSLPILNVVGDEKVKHS